MKNQSAGIAAAPAPAKNPSTFPRTHATTAIPAKMKRNTPALPRSGWSATRRNGTRTIPIAGRTSTSPNPPYRYFPEKYRASANVTAIFANSDGWRLNAPKAVPRGGPACRSRRSSARSRKGSARRPGGPSPSGPISTDGSCPPLSRRTDEPGAEELLHHQLDDGRGGGTAAPAAPPLPRPARAEVVHDAGQRLADELHVLRLPGELPHPLGGGGSHRPVHPDHLRYDAGPHNLAAGRQRRVADGHLQGSQVERPLADPEEQALIVVPPFLAHGPLPFHVRDQPLPLAGEVDPGDRPQSRVPLQLRHPLRPPPAPEGVEVDVARGDDRPGHVDGAVPLFPPAAEDAGERVRVESRTGVEGEDFPRPRSEGDHGPRPVPHRLLGGHLQVHVQRGMHRSAGPRRHLLHEPLASSGRVHFHFPAAVHPSQNVVRQPLQAVRADEVPHHQRFVSGLFHLLRARLPDVAEDVSEGLPVRVAPLRLHQDGEPAGVPPVALADGDLLETEVPRHGEAAVGIGPLRGADLF